MVVLAKWTLTSHQAKHLQIPCEAEYCFCADGAVSISITTVPPSFLPCLARIGLRFGMPRDFNKIKWFGLGPHEAYDDRKSSAYLGVFEKHIEDMHTSYIYPQENGRRAEPRWAILQHESNPLSRLVIIPNPMNEDLIHSHSRSRSGSDINLEFESGEDKASSMSSPSSSSAVRRWGFNVSKFSMESLDRTNHNFELQADSDESIFVHVDSRSLGIGGDDSWTPHLPKDMKITADGKTRFETRLWLVPGAV